ncbi:MFS transporter [Paenibacillus sp. P26]|nr:MFS transporter [Paenibacillus sp. P26]UUZ96930.1 MFS transporter [Paenibacillus sp. P25]
MDRLMAKPSGNVRWGIGILLGFGVIINYLDRTNISVAGSQMAADYGWSGTELGILFAAFSWTYTLMMIPVGIILDKIGVKWITRIVTILWSIATLCTALMGGFTGVLIMRMILGVAEAPGYPASAKATGYWFPLHERGLATSLFDGAAKLTSAIGVGICTWAILHWGWQGAFIVTGLLNLVYAAVYWFKYRDPSEHPKLSLEEREYIEKHGGQSQGGAEGSFLSNFMLLLRARKLWGFVIGYMAYGYANALMVSWLPAYMTKELHLSLAKGGLYTSIPWIIATLSEIIIGGWLLDKLITKGYPASKIRKIFLVAGMIIGCTLLLEPTTRDPNLIVVYLSIGLGGLAFASCVGWSIPAIIAPKGMVGSVSSVMNFFNNLMGATVPIITGFIVDKTGSFNSAFISAGVVLVIGICSYVFLLGDISQIKLNTKRDAAEQAEQAAPTL